MPNVTLFPQFCQRAAASVALVYFPESGSPAPYPAPVCCARTCGGVSHPGDYASAGGKPGVPGWPPRRLLGQTEQGDCLPSVGPAAGLRLILLYHKHLSTKELVAAAVPSQKGLYKEYNIFPRRKSRKTFADSWENLSRGPLTPDSRPQTPDSRPRTQD